MTATAATATRYLYLTRHGEASEEESAPLTRNGRRQAALLAERLKDSPVSVIHHGPLPRAAQTAQLIGERLEDVPLHATETAGDYVPHAPERAELPPDCADLLLRFLAPVTTPERERGALLARRALEQFTGPPDGHEDRHELIVTHGFLIGWLVSHAMHAPPWRWMGQGHGNAALTVIRYAPGRPASVLYYNDVRHLPAELRWTGFSEPPPG